MKNVQIVVSLSQERDRKYERYERRKGMERLLAVVDAGLYLKDK